MSLKVTQQESAPANLLAKPIFVAVGSEVRLVSFASIPDRSGFIRVTPPVPGDGRGYRVLCPGDQVIIEYEARQPKYDLVVGE